MGRKFKWLKKASALLLLVAMAAQPLSSLSVQAAEAKSAGQYEIYPTPQSVVYEDDSFIIRSSVNIVYENGIDNVTKNKLDAVLESKGVTGTVSDKIVSGTTNILVGIKDSDGYVDQYADKNIIYDEAIFDHYDPYVLSIDNGTITVLGETTDGAFYGIVSLMHIFNQIDGKTISNLQIEDYANTQTRGFIEGYYGIPWSNENRMSLMEFGGQFKMTSYVFAPKDDPYHSAQWRVPYPEEKLAEIKEMAELGNANKCRFVWTIHPFMNGGITANSYDADIAKIIAKFEQLYNVGVRQFGVLGDDAGSLPRSVVIRTMTDLQEWVDEKGDVYNLVFCPGGYNDAWQGNYSELNEYDAGFPADIDIFWTGQAVCQPVEQLTLTNFRTKNLPAGREPRRSPLFWLNWPVNDINMSRLMMGKGSLLHNDVNPDDLAGVVTNPMQDAQASKVALFAVADFAWNISDFNADESWADGFKYIDAEAGEALHTLAKHMSDPAPNGHGLVLAESEELLPLLNEFRADYEAGTYNGEAGEALIAEFEEIIAACDEFHELSKNEELKKEILPFSNALKALSNAVIDLIKTAEALEEGDSANVWSYYSAATAELAASENIYRATLNGTAAAMPAAKHIRPFATKLNELLSVAVNGIVDDSKIITSLITNRTDTPNGALEKLTDNNESTEVIWSSPNSTTAGTYIGLSYSKPITLNDVTFKMGQSGNERDTFDAGKIQYTVDGKEWIDLEGTEFTSRVNNVTKDGLDLQVKGVRLISTADKGNMWLGCKDIVVNIDSYSTEEGVSPLNKTVIKSSTMSVYDGSEGNLTDGNVSSGVWYKTAGNTAVEGDYLGLDLGEVVEIGKVTIAVGLDSGDKWESYKLEYSSDNSNWTTFETYTGASSGQDVYEENFDGIEARYVRITNLTQKGVWVKFGEFNVERFVVDTGNQYIYTNAADCAALGAEHSEDKVSVAEKAGITLKPGEYVGVKLDRIKDITNIDTDKVAGLTLESSKNEIVWTAVAGDVYEDARFVRLMNKTAENVTFDLTKFVVESFEIQPISVLETSFGQADTHLKAFDQDRTTEAVLQNSQYKGQFITYDLGQVIDLDSLKLVLHDGTTDYPRHAKVSVSLDGNAWEDVMLIGNQDSNNPGEAENTDNISELFPDHEISYYTKSVDGLNKQVRFIKFEITRNKAGADKWVRIREIELNGGDMYLPSNNDPTVVTTAGESTGNTVMNIIDGDVATTYAPVGDEAGSLTYYISENTEIKKITILQSPSTISNAEVVVEAVENGIVKEVAVGKLSSSLNEFDVSAFTNVLSVNVVWNAGNVPEIHELITSTAAIEAADKAALDEYYKAHKSEDTSAWTAESKKAYADAVAMAKEVLENSYATQAMVDSAYASLKNAVDHKVEIGDIAAFKAAVEAAEAAVLAEDNYTVKTFKVYAERLAAAKEVNEDAQLSQAELDTLLAALEDAKNGLVYEISSMEELTLLVETVKALNEDDYAKASYDSLAIVIASAESLIEAGKTERQNPVNVKAAIVQVEDAVEALVDLTELKNVIAEAEAITSFDGYTQESIDKFNAALDAARDVCAKPAASNEEVATAASALEAAMTFDTTGDANAVTAEIARLKALKEEDYTAASYDAMMAKIAEIEEELKGAYTDENCTVWTQELRQVSDALVNVKALKAAVAEAKALKAEDYTEASYAAFAAAIVEAETLYADGSQEAVDAAIVSLSDMVSKLHVATEICKAAIDVYEAELEGNYTEASKKALADAIAVADAAAEAGMTKAELDQVKAELAELAELLVSTDALIKAIADAKAIDKAGYTAASVAKYEAMIAQAEELLKAGSVTEIADMVKALNAPEKVLEKIGDFSKLLDAIVYWKEEYQKLDLDKYTADSKKNLLGEIDKAEFMVLTGEASEEQVAAQIKSLEAAFEGLEEIEEEPSQPTVPSQPTQPTTPVAPATGDTANMMVYLACMMIAVITFVAAKRKKFF